MTDTERLAALLIEVFPAANRNQWPFAAMDVAAALVAAGVRVDRGGVLPPPDPSIVGTEYGPLRRDKSRIDPDRLARALHGAGAGCNVPRWCDDNHRRAAAAIAKAYEEDFDEPEHWRGADGGERE